MSTDALELEAVIGFSGACCASAGVALALVPHVCLGLPWGGPRWHGMEWLAQWGWEQGCVAAGKLCLLQLALIPARAVTDSGQVARIVAF